MTILTSEREISYKNNYLKKLFKQKTDAELIEKIFNLRNCTDQLSFPLDQGLISQLIFLDDEDQIEYFYNDSDIKQISKSSLLLHAFEKTIIKADSYLKSTNGS